MSKELEVRQDLEVLVEVSKERPVILFDEVSLREQVEDKLKKYENLVITKDNKQELKEAITLMNNTSRLLNRRRIDVVNELKEYYKVSEMEAKIKSIDELVLEVKTKLEEQVKRDEDYDKALKENDARDLLNELKVLHKLDFIEFKDIKLNITLGISNKRVLDTVNEFVNDVLSKLSSIEYHPHKVRVLAKYKQTLNMDNALRDVGREIEAENKIIEEVKVETPKVVELKVEKVIEEEKQYDLKLWATVSQVRKLQTFLKEEGIKYE